MLANKDLYCICCPQIHIVKGDLYSWFWREFFSFVSFICSRCLPWKTTWPRDSWNPLSDFREAFVTIYLYNIMQYFVDLEMTFIDWWLMMFSLFLVHDMDYGARLNRLDETVPTSTNNLCFWASIKNKPQVSCKRMGFPGWRCSLHSLVNVMEVQVT